jgi:hypothetical protein
MNSPVIASTPYPARYRTWTMNREFVTASVAWQSMQLEFMDCFTAFAMTVQKVCFGCHCEGCSDAAIHAS